MTFRKTAGSLEQILLQLEPLTCRRFTLSGYEGIIRILLGEREGRWLHVHCERQLFINEKLIPWVKYLFEFIRMCRVLRRSGRHWVVVEVRGISIVTYKLCEVQRSLCQVKSNCLYL